MEEFVQLALESHMSVLIHSKCGKTRSIVIVVAFLMSRYSWSLVKALEFVYSKKTSIELSAGILKKLTKYQKALQMQTGRPNLSQDWASLSEKSETFIEERLLTHTYLNSLTANSSSEEL